MAVKPDREARLLTGAGALLAALAVALGAFGAHALHHQLTSQQLGLWHTATEYLMWHALGVLAIGLAGSPAVRLAGWLLAAGAMLFAASLYAMALGGAHWLAVVTPLGGLTMIAGWLLLAWRAAPARLS